MAEERHVSDIMTTAAETASPGQPLGELVERMTKRRFSCVFVCDRGQPVGVVTERDLVRLLSLADAERRMAAPVREFMTESLVLVRAKSTIAVAMSMLREREIRHLPVVDDAGRMLGMVTQTDLLRAFAEEVEYQRQALEVAVNERTKELADANMRLEALSLQDGLLGIGNRRAMEFQLANLHDLARRYGTRYGVVLFDVDHFKQYNDSFGHLAGDEVLKQVSGTIESIVRAPDRVFLYGGEEILVALPETGADGAYDAGDRIRASIEQLGVAHPESSTGAVTVSGGSAVSHDPRFGVRPSWVDVVESADRALYEAKQAGRNRVERAAPQPAAGSS